MHLATHFLTGGLVALPKGDLTMRERGGGAFAGGLVSVNADALLTTTLRARFGPA